MPKISFEFHRSTYTFDDGTGSRSLGFYPLDYPTDLTLENYLQCRGHVRAKALLLARRKWGENEFDIPLPKVPELLVHQALSPFFVFQVFCVCLWMFDEYWHYAVFTLLMLVFFEITQCMQRINNLEQLNAMRRPPHAIMAYRATRWELVQSNTLVPGDLCSLVRSGHKRAGALAATARGVPSAKKQAAVLCPCDMLLLRGSCIVNEAMLTGESVPKMKDSVLTALRADPRAAGQRLFDAGSEADGAGASARSTHVVLGGTEVLQSQLPPAAAADASGANAARGYAVERVPRPPDGGSLAMVLRSGFHTTQGSLMRTILFATEPVGAGSAEAFAFICVLLVFALAASGYVLYAGLQDPRQDRWKLFLHCTMILTSVVPPELPMELSLAVTTSLARLQKLAIYCTEPYRIPFAGKVDVCCFDKTGTLTSDDLRVRGVAALDGSGDGRTTLRAPKKLHPATDPAVLVLGACHQLVYLDRQAHGDPMEKAALKSVGWSFARSGAMAMTERQRTALGLGEKSAPRLRVAVRYAFSSATRRMSVVAVLEHAEPAAGERPLQLLCKGAPEAIAPLLAQVPPGYDAAYRALMRDGARVLALAHKRMAPGTTLASVRATPRDEVEAGLEFAGFLVLDCPLKDDSSAAVRTLMETGHRVVIITGDNVLTACKVARQLAIVTRPNARVLVLDAAHGRRVRWVPVSNDGDEQGVIAFDGGAPSDAEGEGYDLALPVEFSS